jgi:biopolymer transport protein ExbB/TolQ
MGFLKGIADAFEEGGWGMWPILLWAILTIAIGIERAVYLYKSTVDKDKLLALMKSQIMSGNVQGAIKVCSGNPTPMTRIVQAGLMKFNRPDEEVQAAMDEASLRELPKVEKRTAYLGTLANLAVLSGLLGTVTGMIKSFKAAAGAAASEKAKLLASGISEAMNCTAFGIGTALLGLIFFAFLMGKTQTINDDINEVSVQIVNLVTGHRGALKGAAA